jgi:carbonic anhydrase
MKTVEITYRYETDAAPRARPADADAARLRLDEGSRAFAALLDNLAEEKGTARRVIQVDSYDLGLLGGDESTPKQRPFAAVLGCSDARVPIELIFNEGPNDLFVVRVAGNSLGSDVLGSLKYAVEHLGGSLKLVVVLGHSGCGALSAAVDVFLNPGGYLALASKHLLRNLLDRLMLVVHASAKAMAATFGPDVTRRPGYRQALIEASVVANAALAAYTVQQELGRIRPNGLRTAYGVYLLGTRQIWAPRSDGAEHFGLADPPVDLEAFGEFGEAVARSERIGSLLESGSTPGTVSQRPA